ncbi:hypothetical protein GY45DRAFT_408464 [Cubamyces sp. BRFM 1775]|nr:hypothetical protein GY45DRAFT_408464 [Cubamyces sp. BRFM 1775]
MSTRDALLIISSEATATSAAPARSPLSYRSDGAIAAACRHIVHVTNILRARPWRTERRRIALCSISRPKYESAPANPPGRRDATGDLTKVRARKYSPAAPICLPQP